MKKSEATLQQEGLGIVGVILIYGACFLALFGRGKFRPIPKVSLDVIRELEGYNSECLRIFSRKLFEQISGGDPE